MGLLSGLLGNASEVDSEEVERFIDSALIDGEQVEKAYKVIRDVLVFTNKRLILVDRQGVRGNKAEVLSIPYSKITKFSKESAGTFDLDAELKIWLGSESNPLTKEFKAGDDIDQVYKILSQYTLG